jgi:hypothetical protein
MTRLLSKFPRVSSVSTYFRCHYSKPSEIIGIENGMKRWIKDYVIDHKICPFAKKSAYDVHVWPHREMVSASENDGYTSHAGNVVEFMNERVSILSAKQKEIFRPNEFLCFPYISEFEDYDTFKAFYFFVVDSLETVGGDFDVHNLEIDVQAFLFHPKARGNRTDPDAENFRFRCPWPSFHLIAKKDLDKERKGNEDVGLNIFLRNERIFQDPKSRRKLEKIVETFQTDQSFQH